MVFNDSGKAEDGLPVLNIAETLLGCFHSGVICLDQNRNVCAINPQAEQLLGIRADDVLQKPSNQLPDPLFVILNESHQLGKSFNEGQILLNIKPGERQLLQVTVAFVSVISGDTTFCIILLSNLGAVQSLEGKIRRLDQLASIGTFAAGMAHEIKNAMQPISTLIDTILTKLHKEMIIADAEDRRLVEIVGNEMGRINTLLAHMLRFSGPVKPFFSLVHAHEILSDSIYLIQHQLESKNIKLLKSFQAESDLLKADAYQLKQAFLNIFFNAIEAMTSGGILAISTSFTLPDSESNLPARFKLCVEDSGIGISPENMSRLFDTFFTTKSDGTGLGLAITRRIIKEHLGEIEVQSNLDEGTIISIVLPVSN